MNKVLKTVVRIQNRISKLNMIIKILKRNKKFKSNIIPQYKEKSHKNDFLKRVDFFKETSSNNAINNFSSKSISCPLKSILISSTKNRNSLLSNLYKDIKIKNNSQVLSRGVLSAYGFNIKKVSNNSHKLNNNILKGDWLEIKKIKSSNVNNNTLKNNWFKTKGYNSILRRYNLDNKSKSKYSNIKTNITPYNLYNNNNNFKTVKPLYNNYRFADKLYKSNSNKDYKSFKLSKTAGSGVASTPKSIALKDNFFQNSRKFIKAFSKNDAVQVLNNYYISPSTEININSNNSTEVFNKVWNKIGNEITTKLNSSTVLPHY